MTIYNEVVALTKLCELKSGNNNDKKLINEIFENTKGLIDLYLESTMVDSKFDIEEIRQILAKGLLEAIESFSIDMVVPFSVYAYHKMDNILEEDLEYLESDTISLDRIYEDIESSATLSSKGSLDDIKSNNLRALAHTLNRIDIKHITSLDEVISLDIKRILLSLTIEERNVVLRKLNVSEDKINLINTILSSEEIEKGKNYSLK